MTFPRGNLPAINFAEKTATQVQADIITAYEAIAQRSLASGDPVRLFLEAIAAIIINQRSIIDFSAKQNLLSYAQDEYIDYLGELVGVERLAAQPALTTIQFTLSSVQGGVYTIPAGTQVVAGDLTFSTIENLDIAIGDLTGSLTAQCLTAGTVGNNLLPGQIRTLVNPLPFVESVTNTTTTSGGAEIENDENFVERIRLAPSTFSVAGPTDSYRFWALSANQSIIDVNVSSPTSDDIKQLVNDVLVANAASQTLIDAMNTALDAATWPGTVDVRPLLTSGVIPAQEILDQVDAVLSADDIRPLTDHVQVLAPAAVNYNIDVQYWLKTDDVVSSTTVQAAVDSAVDDYILWQKSKIGRDINPDELVARMKNAGAKRVVMTSPIFTVLTNTEVAQELSVTVSYQGLEDA
ncbi:MAG: baseplate J/gp47 family protein [Methyloprofundus sp.]|nr:baseplate J/gp47 family protein [Methyloprofundus sp.]